VETSHARGLICWFYAIAVISVLLVLPAENACAKTASEQSISEDYKVCVRGVGQLAISRYDIIDVEKVVVGWRKQRPFAEFAFNEMGVGAYSKMLRDTASKGVVLSAGSDVVVYGQMFQSDGLLFIAKSLRANRDPVWIYAKFFGPVTSDSQASAMKIMAALRTCAA
jgi:hypothetical protein